MIDRGQHEILRLSYAHMEGQATAAQLARLESLLVADSEAREIYIEFMELAASLCWQRSADHHEVLLGENLSRNGWTQAIQAGVMEASTTPGSMLVEPKTMWQSINRRVLWSITGCAALFVIYFVGISWNMLGRQIGVAMRETGRFRQPPVASSELLLADEVATIRNQVDVRWGAVTPMRLTAASTQGNPVQRGESLSLMSGMIEIRLRQGVTMMVEGPAEWTIDGDNAATLTRGKLLARVPPQAVGFAVTTPTARYVDLGTEFGVAVADDASSYMRVFRGKVLGDVRETVGAGSEGATSVVARAGHAIQSVAGAALQVSPVIGDDNQFAGLRGLMSKPRANLKQEHVLAHWRFENLAPAGNGGVTQIAVVTDASGRGNHLDFWPGEVGDYPSSQKVPPPEMFNVGYDGGERSFHAGALNPARNGVLFHESRRLGNVFAFSDDFTIEGYFCTAGDRSNSGPMTLLFKDRYVANWEIAVNDSQPGALSLAVWCDDGDRRICTVGGEGTFEKSFNVADGRWHYFAARAQRDSGELSLLVAREDGQIAKRHLSLPPQFKFHSESGHPEHNLFVGRREHKLADKGQFVGFIDEVRISRQWLKDSMLLYPVSSTGD